MKSFASDNYASAHPDVLAAMAEVNDGHAVSYGADPWTAQALSVLRDHFGQESVSLLVFNGSGANIVSIRAVCRPWEAVICADTAHVNVDEGGAPERIAGVKLLTVVTTDGKLTPEDVQARVQRVGDEHAVQPRLVTITQSSEYGTRYSAQEIRALADAAHELGLALHMDGSRLSNAAAGLDCGLGELTTDVGVDVLSLGGTKNGMLLGEAVVFLDPSLSDGAKYLRKQTLQLASKGRFLAAQFTALFGGDLWRRNAAHANEMAARLAGRLGQIPGVTITQRVQANGVFAVLPRDAADAVRARWPFYTWDESKREERLMCSWDTTAEEVDAFADALGEVCGATPRS
ncbi:MAG TPA: low specificity L-threonine aldolase [Solirubrobacteraceae bacterium]|nr:low specificity L-threonine aldolase [Solirubrobacteraceae bacterium]